jgi:hypothetical protein
MYEWDFTNPTIGFQTSTQSKLEAIFCPFAHFASVVT